VPIGLTAFVIGVVLVVGGTTWEGFRLAASFAGDTSITFFTDLRRAIGTLGQPLIFNGIALYVAGRLFEHEPASPASQIRRWIDRNVFAIGVVMLLVGLAATVLAAVRHLLPVVSENMELSVWGVAMNAFAALGDPFAYSSVLLIIAGLWMERRA
jgi:hypothetical protein